MARFGLIGSSYSSQSPVADSQRTVNWYVEQIESGMGKSAAALYPCPGTKLFATLPDSPARGGFTFQGRMFAVGGTHFCEIASDGTVTDRGTVANDGSQVTFAANQANQLVFASGGTLYLFDLVGNTLSTPTMLGSVLQVHFCDGYFLALLSNGNFQISALLDGTSWPGSQVVEVSAFPEKPVSMLVDHKEVWLWSDKHGIVYYDSGSTSIFDPIGASAFLENGIGAPASRVRIDNSVFWLDSDERGNGIARRAQGYNPARVSNHAIEYQWSKYSTIADAIGYAYQDQGHSFWVLYFPTANATWAYDVATQQWHERGFWNSTTGQYEAHHSRCYVSAFGKHLVGDWQSGKIYELSINYIDDDGSPIRRMRISPPMSPENEWMYFEKVQIDAEVGLPSNLTGPSSAPMSYVLPDDSGGLWRVILNDTGDQITTTKLTSGSAETILLSDYSTAGTVWQLMVDSASEDIELVQVPYSVGIPFTIPIATTPGMLQSQLYVTNGQLNTNAGMTVQRAPMIALSWSNDGAHSWSNEQWASAGLTGQYLQRLIWRRLGRARQRTWKVVASDPVPWRLIEGDLTGTGFTPSERLNKQYAKVS